MSRHIRSLQNHDHTRASPWRIDFCIFQRSVRRTVFFLFLEAFHSKPSRQQLEMPPTLLSNPSALTFCFLTCSLKSRFAHTPGLLQTFFPKSVVHDGPANQPAQRHRPMFGAARSGLSQSKDVSSCSDQFWWCPRLPFDPFVRLFFKFLSPLFNRSTASNPTNFQSWPHQLPCPHDADPVTCLKPRPCGCSRQ